MKKIKNCTACNLCKTRKNVIIGRGFIPCDILFLDNSPERNADILGEAFPGEGGKLLDQLILEASIKLTSKIQFNIYISSAVLCFPMDDTGVPREPYENEVLSCMPNIFKIILEANPKKVCFIGKLAEKYYKNHFPESFSITHPNYMAKTGGIYSLDYVKAVKTLTEEFKNL